MITPNELPHVKAAALQVAREAPYWPATSLLRSLDSAEGGGPFTQCPPLHWLSPSTPQREEVRSLSAPPPPVLKHLSSKPWPGLLQEHGGYGAI
eukprot:CAMPEP_0182856884 /NCGR_PEP_ID=MMETSP0034_2-20130328/2722_1 /TAXON_ID=156128 /ORGANISM="Nephroselmis pyriformis, Strain CCMP717" /LENGTH=93 /DNA_ID=CAMNT_0024988049 /DNA_START=410 /DNA_END=690 /DNA_ORIENTATION=-